MRIFHWGWTQLLMLLMATLPWTGAAQASDAAQVQGGGTKADRPRIALVLSGGGARAAYQVGVLRAIATRAVDRSMQGVGGYAVARRSVSVAETTDAVTVAVTYTAPQTSFLRSSFVPSPGHVIRARATFELPVD